MSHYAGLPIALAVTGRYVAAAVSDGLDFEYVCDNYFQDLEENENLGATVLDSAIRLSLNYLNSKLKSISNVAFEHSIYQMYISLCVMEKQQWLPVAVLGRMWGVNDRNAARVAGLFKSMSLAKTSVQGNSDGKKELGLRIHDLHHDYCLRQAKTESEIEGWHFRLLKGHMPALPDSTHRQRFVSKRYY